MADNEEKTGSGSQETEPRAGADAVSGTPAKKTPVTKKATKKKVVRKTAKRTAKKAAPAKATSAVPSQGAAAAAVSPHEPRTEQGSPPQPQTAVPQGAGQATKPPAAAPVSTPRAEPPPSSGSFWPKVVIAVALIVAGFLYIRSIAHQPTGGEQGSPPAAAPQQGAAALESPESLSRAEAQPESPAAEQAMEVSRGPGSPPQDAPVEVVEVTVVEVQSKVEEAEEAEAAGEPAPSGGAQDQEVPAGTAEVAADTAVAEGEMQSSVEAPAALASGPPETAGEVAPLASEPQAEGEIPALLEELEAMERDAARDVYAVQEPAALPEAAPTQSAAPPPYPYYYPRSQTRGGSYPYAGYPYAGGPYGQRGRYPQRFAPAPSPARPAQEIE